MLVQTTLISQQNKKACPHNTETVAGEHMMTNLQLVDIYQEISILEKISYYERIE